MNKASLRFVFGFVLTLGAAAGTCSAASRVAFQAAWPPEIWQPAPQHGMVWLPGQNVFAGGVSLYVAPFRSSLHPADAARILAADVTRFQRLQAFPNLVVLSGLANRAHWLAYVRRTATGSEGYVSFLPFGGTPCVDCL